ncbi:helix-turn-helix domain-containing protein [Streptomyces microflavus]|uniref:helix-turn-helix domain-containing protein n=1 Tax=Streptomyces microflavus TaxID=1919 RepID=UPI0034157AD6
MNEVFRHRTPGGEDTLLLTVREAYMRLRISKWKLYDLIGKRQLDTVKIGRRTFVPIASLEAFVRKLWQRESFA